MLKKTIILIFACLLIHPEGKTQFDTAYAKSRIRACADSFTMGYLTKNWDLYTRFSYAPLVAKVGGAATYIAIINETRIQTPDSCWKKYEPGSVIQVIKTEGDMQAVIELNSILEFNGERTTTTSHLIAESWDAGYFWTFFDPLNDSSLARFVKPDLSPSIVIPQKKEKTEPSSASSLPNSASSLPRFGRLTAKLGKRVNSFFLPPASCLLLPAPSSTSSLPSSTSSLSSSTSSLLPLKQILINQN